MAYHFRNALFIIIVCRRADGRGPGGTAHWRGRPAPPQQAKGGAVQVEVLPREVWQPSLLFVLEGTME